MRRVEFLSNIAELFSFKTLTDESGNEYVVFNNSALNRVDRINDKTGFEAIENHVHILEHVKRADFNDLENAAGPLIKAMLSCLQSRYPQKRFIIYATISTDYGFVIRFHQKWTGEISYFDPDTFDSAKVRILSVESADEPPQSLNEPE